MFPLPERFIVPGLCPMRGTLLLFAVVAAAHAQNGRIYNESDAHNQRGMQLAQAGRVAEALKEFRASVAIAPDAAVYNNIALAETQLKNYPAALAASDSGLEFDPNHIVLYYRRGVILNLLGRTREGEADLAYGHRRDPSLEQAWAEEIAHSRAAAKRFPESPPLPSGLPNTLFDEAVRRYSARDSRGALDPLNAVIARTGDSQAILYRARCYNDLRHYQLALDDATAAIRALPRYAEAYRIRARVWSAYANYGHALSDLNDAIRLNPRLGLAYVDLSLLNFRFRPNLQAQIQGDLDSAVKADPENPFVWYQHAGVFLSRDQPEPAVLDLNRAISLKPDMAVAYASRAVLYYRLGQNKLGDSDVRRALKLDPSLEYSIDTQIKQNADYPAIRAHIEQMREEMRAGLGLGFGQSGRCSMYFGGAYSACMINDMTKARREEARQHGIELK